MPMGWPAAGVLDASAARELEAELTMEEAGDGAGAPAKSAKSTSAINTAPFRLDHVQYTPASSGEATGFCGAWPPKRFFNSPDILTARKP